LRPSFIRKKAQLQACSCTRILLAGIPEREAVASQP
jgi:hypothetical protein